MKDIAIAGNILPLAEFESKAGQLLRRSAKDAQPIIITHNGRAAGVVLSPAEFDRLREQMRFVESVAAGSRDAETGRTISTSELRRRLKQRRRPQ
jgi:prevent-host-death family protein